MKDNQRFPFPFLCMQATPSQQQQGSAAGSQFRMFAQVFKVDAEKRLVYGRATQEVVDKSDEIFDYEKSKPYFKAWSDSFAAATEGKSLGNVRAMHGKVSAGVVKEIIFNDAEKAIDICSKITDDNEWNKTLEGNYTGYSIGGSYVGDRVTEKIGDRAVKRFVADPTEISIVDNPCVPTAKFFDVVKADGVIEKVAFKAPELTVTGTDDEVAEFAKVMNESGLSMADAIALVKAGGKQSPVTEPAAVDKGMWNVQDFAQALACIASVAASAEDDAQWEGDNSPVPEKLRTWLASGVAIFKEMAAEEASELLTSLKQQAGEVVPMMVEAWGAARDLRKLEARISDPKSLTIDEAMKVSLQYGEAWDPGDTFVKRVMAKAKDTAGHAQKMHDMTVDMGGKCAEKAAPAPVAKGVEPNVELTTLRDELTKARADIAALQAQPIPHVTVLRMAQQAAKPVTKEQDTGGAAAALGGEVDPESIVLTKDEYIYDPITKQIDYATSRIQAAAKRKRATA